jgi:plastocyanin
MVKRLALLLLAALAVAGPAAARTSTTTTLQAVTGPGFTITVTNGGKPVKTLKPGSYKVVVSDKSRIHNFHLIGPGVNKQTAVSFVGTATWTLTLKAGTYTYQCDLHASLGMQGSFKVG